MTSHLTKLTALWPPFRTSTGVAPPAREIPSTLVPVARRKTGQPDPKRTKITFR